MWLVPHEEHEPFQTDVFYFVLSQSLSLVEARVVREEWSKNLKFLQTIEDEASDNSETRGWLR